MKAHFIYSKNEQAFDLDFLYKGIGTKKKLTFLRYIPSQEAKGEDGDFWISFDDFSNFEQYNLRHEKVDNFENSINGTTPHVFEVDFGIRKIIFLRWMFIEFSQRPGGVVWITFGEKLTQHQVCGQIYQFEKRIEYFKSL